ncbi:hypothetical protein TSUD_411710 [Trifolium subterraneum]|uniref:F-box domain-containing protein n=1 Tax=Trifolium subterraneum TaxID=3900 RepID=A0A2Z6P5N1_TRISU|nr:hypothetical protein TSUD_411710 [Trifolium subterraneum]
MKRKRHRHNKEKNEDRLSALPDDALHHILSFSDAKLAVQSSILSKRWKNLWKSLPTLKLTSKQFTTLKAFTKFVSHILSHRDASASLYTFDFHRHEATTWSEAKQSSEAQRGSECLQEFRSSEKFRSSKMFRCLQEFRSYLLVMSHSEDEDVQKLNYEGLSEAIHSRPIRLQVIKGQLITTVTKDVILLSLGASCTLLLYFGQTVKVKLHCKRRRDFTQRIFKDNSCPFYNGNFSNVSMSFSTHINMPKKELMTNDLHYKTSLRIK